MIDWSSSHASTSARGVPFGSSNWRSNRPAFQNVASRAAARIRLLFQLPPFAAIRIGHPGVGRIWDCGVWLCLDGNRGIVPLLLHFNRPGMLRLRFTESWGNCHHISPVYQDHARDCGHCSTAAAGPGEDSEDSLSIFLYPGSHDHLQFGDVCPANQHLPGVLPDTAESKRNCLFGGICRILSDKGCRALCPKRQR